MRGSPFPPRFGFVARLPGWDPNRVGNPLRWRRAHSTSRTRHAELVRHRSPRPRVRGGRLPGDA